MCVVTTPFLQIAYDEEEEDDDDDEDDGTVDTFAVSASNSDEGRCAAVLLKTTRWTPCNDLAVLDESPLAR